MARAVLGRLSTGRDIRGAALLTVVVLQPCADKVLSGRCQPLLQLGSHIHMFRSAITKTLLSPSAASRAALRPVGARAYHEKVISHYEKPRNVRRSLAQVWTPLSDKHSTQVGSLPKGDLDVGTGLVGAPAYVFIS